MAMETEAWQVDKGRGFTRGRLWLKCLRLKMYDISRQTAQVAKDDPRRLIHSIKVGLAITVVSLLYYFQPLYSSFGVSAMWAIVTVVVVFEFHAGATVGKGVNRGLATLAAGGLGLGTHYMVRLTGRANETILTALFDFLLAVALTYVRFFPKIKARFDYGMMIFILTFCMVSISGLQTDGILELAQKRLLTVLLGVLVCVAVSVCIWPVWAGEDLHRLVARNLKELGSFLEGFAEECMRTSDGAENGRRSLVNLSSIVVDSKSKEETLANFARWEPGHGRFMYCHPWIQYLKIGILTRQCASRVEALNNSLNTKTQTKETMNIWEALSGMSSELGKALKQLAWSIETMTKQSSPNTFIDHMKVETKNLKSLLRRGLWQEHYSSLLQVIPTVTTASLLIDAGVIVETIAEAVNELSFMAKFEGKESDEGIGNSDNGVEEVGMIDNISVDGEV